MPPFHYVFGYSAAKDNVLPHHVANPHLSTHMATEPSNIHAAIPLRSATKDSKNKKNYVHMNKHSLKNTEEAPIRAGSSAAAPGQTQGTLHRRPEPLYTEKHKVSCPGFLPKRNPCNIHTSMTMRFAASHHKPASLDAHGNTTKQHPCSHSTAICNKRFKKTNRTTYT